MRYRERLDDARYIEALKTPDTYSLYDRESGALFLNEGTGLVNYQLQSIEDTTLPGFKTLRRCGEFLPPNPVDIITKRTFALPGEVYIDRGSWYPFIARGFLFQGNLPTVGTGASNWWDPYWRAIDEQIVDQVELAAAAKAAGDRWDVLTAIAEMQSTVKTIATYAARLKDVIAKAIRGILKAKRNPSKFLSGEWLQARYGVRPIVYDIMAAIDTFSNLYLELPWVEGRAFQPKKTTRVLDIRAMPGPLGTTWVKERTETTLEMYRSMAYLGLKGKDLRERRFQLDLAVTGYELIPLSFVLDWFIDFGAYVQTLAPSITQEYLGRSVSVKTITLFKEQWHSPTGPVAAVWMDPTSPLPGFDRCYDLPKAFTDVFSYENMASSNGIVVERYQRWPVSGPIPLPNWDINLDWLKFIDLVTIFVGAKLNLNLGQRR